MFPKFKFNFIGVLNTSITSEQFYQQMQLAFTCQMLVNLCITLCNLHNHPRVCINISV